MVRVICCALLTSVLAACATMPGPQSQSHPGVVQGASEQPQPRYATAGGPSFPAVAYGSADEDVASDSGPQSRHPIDPRFDRQVVDYPGRERPGTVVIDTRKFQLYLVEEGGKAIRYGVGVGRPGFSWSGVHAVSAKREWPDWTPPEPMVRRDPTLPRFVAGGPHNPLGARALYLGSTIFRIHGSNEPWTIGARVSSGCIRCATRT